MMKKGPTRATEPAPIHGLLLQRLEPGTRVRADGAVIYVAEDFEVPDHSEGTVEHSSNGVGLSRVRWDFAPDRAFWTSNDSLELVEERSR